MPTRFQRMAVKSVGILVGWSVRRTKPALQFFSAGLVCMIFSKCRYFSLDYKYPFFLERVRSTIHIISPCPPSHHFCNTKLGSLILPNSKPNPFGRKQEKVLDLHLQKAKSHFPLSSSSKLVTLGFVKNRRWLGSLRIRFVHFLQQVFCEGVETTLKSIMSERAIPSCDMLQRISWSLVALGNPSWYPTPL
jgi:hypothetical protein